MCPTASPRMIMMRMTYSYNMTKSCEEAKGIAGGVGESGGGG